MRNYTVTIEFSPETAKILTRWLTFLEGSTFKAIQKQLDDVAKVIVDTSADTQADLANAGKS